MCCAGRHTSMQVVLRVTMVQETPSGTFARLVRTLFFVYITTPPVSGFTQRRIAGLLGKGEIHPRTAHEGP
jgi:hypothetical protein